MAVPLGNGDWLGGNSGDDDTEGDEEEEYDQDEHNATESDLRRNRQAEVAGSHEGVEREEDDALHAGQGHTEGEEDEEEEEDEDDEDDEEPICGGCGEAISPDAADEGVIHFA